MTAARAGAEGGGAPPRAPLGELAALFLRLGLTAFGGPAAHVAMMRDEVVVRRRWLSEEAFLDLVGVTQILPGPNSTELAIHIGLERGGPAGLLVAGACFIGPAALASGALAWAYVRYGALPQAGGLLYGVKPVMIAVVAQALVGLGQKALVGWHARAAAAAALGAALAGAHELVAISGAGAIAASVAAAKGGARGAPRAWAPPALGALGAKAAGGAAAAGAGLGAIFAVFLKTGGLLFGSGYVLLAYLRADLVERRGWLTEAQLLDAIAVGQVTPGPVFSTATFVGYLLGGGPGALAATAGIFLPAFVFVALAGGLAARLRRSAAAGAFLDGVNAGSLALMALVSVHLARGALVDAPAGLIAAAGGFALFRLRLNSAYLVLFGALAGLALTRARG